MTPISGGRSVDGERVTGSASVDPIYRRSTTRRVVWILSLLAIALAVAVPTGTATAAKTVRDSLTQSGAEPDRPSCEPSISKSGRFVAFNSSAHNMWAGDMNGLDDCFVRDHATNSLELVSVHSSGALSNRECWGSSISADGRYVAFESNATSLVDGDANERWDVFLRDRHTGITELVPHAATFGSE